MNRGSCVGGHFGMKFVELAVGEFQKCHIKWLRVYFGFHMIFKHGIIPLNFELISAAKMTLSGTASLRHAPVTMLRNVLSCNFYDILLCH